MNGSCVLMVLSAGLLPAELLAVWAVARATRSSPSQAMPLESARVILDRRFASGEIDAEEYARSRRTLEATDAPA